jgi:hypothetical protein
MGDSNPDPKTSNTHALVEKLNASTILNDIRFTSIRLASNQSPRYYISIGKSQKGK